MADIIDFASRQKKDPEEQETSSDVFIICSECGGESWLVTSGFLIYCAECDEPHENPLTELLSDD